MNMTMRRYGGMGKAVREARYLGGWGAFARAHSVLEGTCVNFEQQPEQPGRMWATVSRTPQPPPPPKQTPAWAGQQRLPASVTAEHVALHAIQQAAAPLPGKSLLPGMCHMPAAVTNFVA